MRKHLLYIVLFLLSVLWTSCQKEDISTSEAEAASQYMQFSVRSASDNESEKPCFIFWKESDYKTPAVFVVPTTPYVFRHPEGMIEDYEVPKYNTRYVYPPQSEWVHAVGVAPGSLVEENNTDWEKFEIPSSKAGLIDIQCAPAIRGSQQTPFSNPLVFTHKLAKLDIQGYCGSSMTYIGGDGKRRFINVKDIRVSISSDLDDQWMHFPQKLIWDSGNEQYEVAAYASKPTPEIVAKIFADDVTLEGTTDTSKDHAKAIGNFYFVPGFSTITLKVEAIYIDSTTDGDTPLTGNGQGIARVWDTIKITDIHPELGGNTETSEGESYEIKLMFDRGRIVLGVTLEPWNPDEIHN